MEPQPAPPDPPHYLESENAVLCVFMALVVGSLVLWWHTERTLGRPWPEVPVIVLGAAALSQMAALTMWSVLATNNILARATFWLMGAYVFQFLPAVWELRFDHRFTRMFLAMLAVLLPCLLALRVLGATCKRPDGNASTWPRFSIGRMLGLTVLCAVVVAGVRLTGVRIPGPSNDPFDGRPHFVMGALLGLLSLLLLVSVLGLASRLQRLIGTGVILSALGIGAALFARDVGEMALPTAFLLELVGILAFCRWQGVRLTWTTR